MRPVRPAIEGEQVYVAQDQEEYLDITAVRAFNPAYGIHAPLEEAGIKHNTMIVAYKPTEEEIDMLISGEYVYLHLLTFGGRMQPHILSIGKQQAAEMYGLKPEE